LDVRSEGTAERALDEAFDALFDRAEERHDTEFFPGAGIPNCGG
jgi:hypothetical protein